MDPANRKPLPFFTKFKSPNLKYTPSRYETRSQEFGISSKQIDCGSLTLTYPTSL